MINKNNMDCIDYHININFINTDAIKLILDSDLDNDAKYNLLNRIIEKDIPEDDLKRVIRETIDKLI